MERVISLTESIEFSKIKELSRNSIKVRSRYRIPWERVSLEQRFSFRSFGGRGKEEEKRKKGDTELRFNREVSFRRETFLWIRIELPPSDYAPSSPLPLGHNRSTSNTRCSILSFSSIPLFLPQQRHGENQFVTDIPRRDNVFSCIHAATSKWEVGPRLTQTETECNEAVYAGRRCFHDISSRACVYIFGLEFILFITAASLSAGTVRHLSRWYVDTVARRWWRRRRKGKEIPNANEKEERNGERERERDPPARPEASH